MIPNPRVVYIVISTLAMAVILYVLTLSACALCGIKPEPKVIEYLKDIGLLCAGAISGILSRTGSTPEGPVQPLVVTNPPGQSIAVDQSSEEV